MATGTNPQVQKMVDNIEMYKKLIQAKTGDRAQKLLTLVDAVEEPLMQAPSSSRTEYQGCFPGGLVDHSLNVVRLMSDLNKTYGSNISSESIVIVGLFHDIGKVGTAGASDNEDYYLPKDSDWHRKQGILYEINPKFANVPVSLRSLDILQRFRVYLTSEEFMAIASIKDRSRGEESVPMQGESMLAVVAQQAVKVACIRGKGRTSL